MCLLLPGHLDTQQRPRGGQHQHRVGVSQQAGHHWRWGVGGHYQPAISLQIFSQTNIRNLSIKLV